MFYSANGTFTKKKQNKRIIEGMTEVNSDNSHHHTHFHDELILKDNQLTSEVGELTSEVGEITSEVGEISEDVNRLVNNDSTLVQQNNEMLTRINQLEEQVSELQNSLGTKIGHNDSITIRYPGDELRRLERSGNDAKFLQGSRGNQQVLIIESCNPDSDVTDGNQCVNI